MQWLNWESVLAHFGHNKFLAEVAVRGAPARMSKNKIGMVEWQVVVALRNTLECFPEENDEE